MQLDFAMLALGADYTVTGRLHIFGGAFDLMSVPQVPATVPPFNIVARFIADDVAEESGSHDLAVAVVNPAGERTVVSAGHQFAAERNQKHPDKPGAAIVILAILVTFKSFGQYLFELIVDDRTLKSFPLTIQEATEQNH